jgi:hypothetical protein
MATMRLFTTLCILLVSPLIALAETSFSVVGYNPPRKELLVMKTEGGAVSYLVYDVADVKGKSKTSISLGTKERPEKLGYTARATELSSQASRTEDGMVLTGPNGLTLRFPPESIGLNGVPDPDTKFSVKLKKAGGAESTIAKGLAHSGEGQADALALYSIPGFLILLSSHAGEAEIVKVPQ